LADVTYRIFTHSTNSPDIV